MFHELTPPQQIATSQLPFFNIKGMNQWLEEMPFIDISVNCSEILAALQAIKSLKAPLKAHITALDKINILLNCKVTHFNESYWHEKLPYSQELHNNLEIIISTYLELADNYFQLAKSSAHRRFLFTPKKKTAFLIYKALFAINQAFLKIASCYSAPTSGFWKGIFLIYEFAEKHSLLEVEIDLGKNKTGTVIELYKLILLLQLSNLRQFRPREQYAIYEFLQHYTAFSYINVHNDNIIENPRVSVFSLGSDHPPTLLRFSNNQQADNNKRYFLFADTVNKIFSERFMAEHHAKKAININNTIFFRTYKALYTTHFRQLRRDTAPYCVVGLIGLNNILNYHIENFSEKKPTAKAAPAKIKPGVIHEIGTDYENKYFEIAKMDEIAIDASETQFAGKEQITLTKTDSPLKLEKFEVLNSSAKGYQIVCTEISEKIHAGEIIGIVDKQKKNIEIGLIQHLTVKKQSLELGIELICFESQLAYICRAGQYETPTLCILLDRETVITPANHLNVGDKIRLITHDREKACHLGQAMHLTSSIHHFKLAM